MKCRFCGNALSNVFIDLINSPPANSFLTYDQLIESELYYPLKLFVCENCFLVQIDEYKRSREIFTDDYVYFSSYSTSWLKHAEQYVDMITERLELDSSSQVIEIASNDGYLLQYFVRKGVPVLGIDPTECTAKAARRKNVETIVEFFNVGLAKRLVQQEIRADLVIANNVLAHVPDVMDFVAGVKLILKDDGVVTMEFPHLMQLIENNQFDTIYHEHYSYFSFLTVERIFAAQGLEIFDVEELPTHGGSLRIYAKHREDESIDKAGNVQCLKEKEISLGMNTAQYYRGFEEKVDSIKGDLVKKLLELKDQGQSVVAYGAAAKGNTLLNYCGIRHDLMEFVVDRSPYKQGKYLPGSHIPVVEESELRKRRVDYVLILPWNLKEEIIEQLGYIRDWGGKFILPIPHLSIL